MRQLMQTTPGITIPNFSEDPLGTEGELTPGPPDENPFEKEREMRERIEFERRRKAQASDELLRTVPRPERTNIPPATIKEDPTAGDDPFVFDDVDDEVERLQFPFLEKETDTDLRFDTGEMFQF